MLWYRPFDSWAPESDFRVELPSVPCCIAVGGGNEDEDKWVAAADEGGRLSIFDVGGAYTDFLFGTWWLTYDRHSSFFIKPSRPCGRAGWGRAREGITCCCILCGPSRWWVLYARVSQLLLDLSIGGEEQQLALQILDVSSRSCVAMPSPLPISQVSPVRAWWPFLSVLSL